MPWNVLLLPLVGGYFTLHLWYYSKFRALRLEGHRLLLESAVVGCALLLPARLLISGLKRTPFGPWLRAAWVSQVGEVPYLGTAVAALLLGLTLPIGLNVAAALLLGAAKPKPGPATPVKPPGSEPATQEIRPEALAAAEPPAAAPSGPSSTPDNPSH